MKVTRRTVAGALAVWISLSAGSARADDAAEDPAVEVEIRGSLLPHGEDASGASTRLDHDDLDRPGASTTEILSVAPGVQSARTGAGAELATVTIRGASSAQTPVYVGPIALNDELTGTADLSAVPPFFLRQIEVYRGFSPIELERPGLGGAILLEPTIASGTRARAELGAGSFGERYGSVTFSAGNDLAAGTVALRVEQTNGRFEYRDDRGTRFDESDDVDAVRQNADARSIDLWTAGRIGADAATVDMLFRVFAREQGVPGLGVLPALRARGATRQMFAAASSELDCGGEGGLPCSVTITGWARGSSYRLDDPDGELLFTSSRQVTEAFSAGSRLGFVVTPARFFSLRGGGSLGIARIEVDPLGAADTRASRLSARAYVAAVASPLGWLDVHAEAAVASDALGANGDSSAQVSPQGRVATVVKPVEGLEVFAGATRYARVPTLGEQFGVTATALGNPSLTPETGWSADLGARVERRVHEDIALAGELVAFGRFAEDLIAYQRSSFGALRPFNVGGARVLGFEAAVEARFWRWLHAGANVAFNDARDVSEDRTTTNDTLPFVSRFETTARLGVQLRELVHALRWNDARIEALLSYRAPRTADPAGLIELPSQTLLDLQATVGLERDALAMTVRVSNVLDDRTTDLVGYPLPGRAVHFALSTEWK